MDAANEYMTTEELAALVRAPSAETCRYWRNVGKGPRSVRIGRRVLYRRADVEAWIEGQYTASGGGQ
jgi:predicted DNA-binding transcriptional regulator AlpA